MPGRIGISILSLGAPPECGLDASLRALAGLGREIQIVHRVQMASKVAPREEDLGADVRRRWILQPDNMGFARGHNENVKLLDDCPLIWTLNDDVLFDPSTLGALAAFLEGNSPCVLAGPEIVPIDSTIARGEALGRAHDLGIGWWRPRKGIVEQARGGAGKAPQPGLAHYSFVSGCAPLWKRDAFVELGGFCEPLFLYHEDTDLALRARDRFGDRAIGFCAGAKVFHFEGSSGKPWLTPRRRRDRSVLFDYFDMRNGAYLIARHSRGTGARWSAGLYYTLRAFRKLARPWIRRESRRRTKNAFTLRGMRDGLAVVRGRAIRIDPRVSRAIEGLAR